MYALTAGCSEGLGPTAMAKDYGRQMAAVVHVDASAAIGITQRKGLGKLRHLDTQSLWIQDAVRTKRVGVEKVPGTDNVADIGTKHLDGPNLDKLLKKLGVEFRDGRAVSAPGLVNKDKSESEKEQSSNEQHEPNQDVKNSTAHPAAEAPRETPTEATRATDTPAPAPPVPAASPGGKRDRARQKRKQRKKNGLDCVDFPDMISYLCPCCP